MERIEMFGTTRWLGLAVCCAGLSAAGGEAKTSPAATNQTLDLKTLPANQWVDRPTSGWKGKTVYGPALGHGICGAGDHGILVLDIQTPPGTARVRKLDLASGAWTEAATSGVEVVFRDKFNQPVPDNLHGIQMCYDPDRQVLVGLTSTDLDGRGRVIEFDLKSGKATGYKPDPSPPVVTAASLCYDPVNEEVVLATGGFSPVGGTDGTWLYNGAKKRWRRLETPKEMDEVRVPLEQARDRLIALRWLTWKNLEFRATGREELLDERARGHALAKEAADLQTEFKKLADLAGTNAGKAERPYHKGRLTSAQKRLGEAVAKLAGLEAKLKTGSPEQLESLYRASLLPGLDAVEKAVSELAVTPEPRMSAKLVYDPKNKVLVCFGGDGQDRTWGDTWVYHCEGRWWERRHPAAHPSPRDSRAMAYDPAFGRVVLIRSPRWGEVEQETWIYDAAADEWRQWSVPGAKAAFFLEYDASSGCLAAFNLDLNKCWVLRLDPTAAKAVESKPAPEVAFVATDKDFVLRDVPAVADLGRWKGEMDAWVKSVPPNTWILAPTNGTGRPNWGRTWSSIVFDAERRQIYYRDGGHGSYHGADTDHYDLATGRWFRSDRRFLPPWPMGSYFAWGRSFGYAPWAVHTYKYGLFLNPLRQRLQRSIGQSGRMEGSPPGAVIEYDPDTGRWGRELVPLGAGAGGAFGGGVTVPGVTDGLLSIDNFTRYGQKDGEASYLTKDRAKQWKNLGQLPRAHDDHCFSWFFDPKRQRAMYYGGPTNKQELFALDLTAEAPKWQKLEIKGAGDGKLPLSHREVVYVLKHDVFLMLSASETPYAKGIFEEIWRLDPKDNTFARVELAGRTPPYGGVSNGLQYDPVTDLCFYIAAGSGSPPLYAFRYAPDTK